MSPALDGLGQQESDGQLEAAPQDPDRLEGVESKEEAVTREQLEAASPHLVLDCVDLAGDGDFVLLTSENILVKERTWFFQHNRCVRSGV